MGKKQYKLKNYSDKTDFFSSRKNNWVLKSVVSIVILFALVFVGISAYRPISDYIGGRVSPSPLPDPPKTVDAKPPKPVEATPEPTKEEPAVAVQEVLPVKAIVLPNDTALNQSALEDFIKNIPNGINTVVVTAKNNRGEIFYQTAVPQANEWQAVSSKVIDIPTLKEKLAEKNLQLAVRLSIFSDPIAAKGDLDNNAVMHSSGVIWIDNTLQNGGKAWTTPYSTQVVDYNIALTKELSDMGVNLIILDYMRFPNDPTSSANFKTVEGISRADALNNFYKKALENLQPTNTKLAASAGLWLIEQKNTGINPLLYGGDPMALTVENWVAEIDDIAADSNQVENLYKDNPTKSFILFAESAKNSLILSGSEKEFILY